MSGIRYGQAQKLINLSFKWLYCMDGADKYLERYCHVALIGDLFCRLVPQGCQSKCDLLNWSSLDLENTEVFNRIFTIYQ